MFVLLTAAASVYTGKAGSGWVSTNWSEGFWFSSQEEAYRRAEQFNRNTLLHGLTFHVERVA